MKLFIERTWDRIVDLTLIVGIPITILALSFGFLFGVIYVVRLAWRLGGG